VAIEPTLVHHAANLDARGVDRLGECAPAGGTFTAEKKWTRYTVKAKALLKVASAADLALGWPRLFLTGWPEERGTLIAWSHTDQPHKLPYPTAVITATPPHPLEPWLGKNAMGRYEIVVRSPMEATASVPGEVPNGARPSIIRLVKQ